jgi:pyruvate/2-oxoglutarate dehydrogenase complex dihydrolipoamide dehydrogenase (E3) component
MTASAKAAYIARRSYEYGIKLGEYKINFKRIIGRKDEVVKSFRKSGEKSLEKNKNITFIRGTASFSDRNTISVNIKGGKKVRLSSDLIYINTGGRPKIPFIPGLEKVNFLDSTSIMELKDLPEHLLILGGGYIGLEFGQMFRRFGSKVTIVEHGDQLLKREDKDILEEIKKIFEEEGIRVLLNKEVVKAEKNTKGIKKIFFENAETLSGTHLLVAAGHLPNTEDLNLSAAGIETDKWGYIKTDEKLETSVKGIFALGDVKGGPAFTHISYDDYRIIRDNLKAPGSSSTHGRFVPYVVFIDPQLGRVGLNEKEARKLGKKFLIAKMPMSYIARAIESNETKGLIKIIIDAGTENILGCSVLSMEGGEILAMIQIAMMGNLKYAALKEGIFAHPTLAESLNNVFNTMEIIG